MSRALPDWRTEPVFVLTSDIDWASSFAIEQVLGFARDRGIRPTVFVTHPSAAIAAAAAAGEIDRGIHPNFLPGSTHGDSVDAVIEHCMALVPGCRYWRSHAYVDGSEIVLKLHDAGIRVDSNVCCQMQRGLEPLELWAGIRRFPVFWEDDVHWHLGGIWEFAPYAPAFLTPGLKIVNTHPFMFALNIPDAAAYRRSKGLIQTLDAEAADRLRWTGPGPATFLAALDDTVRDAGYRWWSLPELAAVAEPAIA